MILVSFENDRFQDLVVATEDPDAVRHVELFRVGPRGGVNVPAPSGVRDRVRECSLRRRPDPGLASSPLGETKIACDASPSIPSQFVSANARSGLSAIATQRGGGVAGAGAAGHDEPASRRSAVVPFTLLTDLARVVGAADQEIGARGRARRHHQPRAAVRPLACVQRLDARTPAKVRGAGARAGAWATGRRRSRIAVPDRGHDSSH